MQTHAAQHVPMRSDIRELKTECQNATEKFGIDDSDDVVSNAYDLVKRLEAQELAREEAERTLELLVQTLKVCCIGISVPECRQTHLHHWAIGFYEGRC